MTKAPATVTLASLALVSSLLAIPVALLFGLAAALVWAFGPSEEQRDARQRSRRPIYWRAR